MTEERQVRTGDYPAFPIEWADRDSDPFGLGMSKREHYAALFVAGLLANSSISHDTPPHDLARVAITQADVLVAMLSEADRGDA